LAAPSQLQRMLDYFSLFVRRQLFNFFTDFGRGDKLKLRGSGLADKAQERRRALVLVI
jgi:hypothetical protein